METHGRFMELALQQAEAALDMDEVPVGCVLVVGGEAVAASHNRTNVCNDPLCHAEYIAAQGWCRRQPEAAAPSGPPVFYITIEPCVMCHGILQRLGATVYFGCHNEIFGTRHLTGALAGTCLEDPRCVEILRRFYTRENQAAPVEKRISKKNRRRE